MQSHETIEKKLAFDANNVPRDFHAEKLGKNLDLVFNDPYWSEMWYVRR